MQSPDLAHEEERLFLISSLPPGPAQKRVAVSIVLGMLIALYLTTGPFSRTNLGASSAFIVAHSTAMFVIDGITAALLFAQFFVLRSRSTLVIANGYLYTSCITVIHLASFPGVLAPHGLVGGLQTTPWLYVAWHCGFAMFVITYALINDEPSSLSTWIDDPRSTFALSVTGTLTLVASIGYFVIRYESSLPSILLDTIRFSPNWSYLVGAPIIFLCITAVALLGIRGGSILDLWLAVIMFLFGIAQPMSRLPVPERFNTGWYAIRIVDVISSALVLIVLLSETTSLYARLLQAVRGQRREREARLITGIAVAASIAHEIRQPLTAMITSADAGLRFIDRPAPNLEKAKDAFKQIAQDGHRAGGLITSIRASFKSDAKDQVQLDVNDMIQSTLVIADDELRKHQVAVHSAPTADALAIQGNRIQLQQVVLNLIVNSIAAMAQSNGDKILTITWKRYDSNSVLVSVADNGMGVATSDVDRLFNPLFTTRADGMGIGLSICQAIVEAHGGRLWFTPNAPCGAVFQFTLHVAGVAHAQCLDSSRTPGTDS